MGLHEVWPPWGDAEATDELRAQVLRRYNEAYAALVGLIEAAGHDLRSSDDLVDVWGSMSLRVADRLSEGPRHHVTGMAMAIAAAAAIEMARRPPAVTFGSPVESQPGTLRLGPPREAPITLADLQAFRDRWNASRGSM